MISQHSLYRLLNAMLGNLSEQDLNLFGERGWYHDTLSNLDVQDKATIWRIVSGEGWE